VVAGEAVAGALVARHRELLPGTALVNEYGPTEATVWCTAYDCGTPGARDQVPIGRPVANTRVYVLDPELQPVPVGVPGELHVGGAGVTRGYLNQPAMTAEKFIPDPFAAEPSARLYKTGDLVRWLPDGNLEFLGRVDRQVKVRGYRIEPGEIEAALLAHPDVREAVVLARQDHLSGEKQLVAYVSGNTGAEVSPPALRAHLERRLPAYMVPSHLVPLEDLPRLPNGKVDARALPVPGAVPVPRERPFVAPRGPREEVLAGIWSRILNVPQVGVDDNFFELGGDSILALQVVSRAARAGLSLALEQVFRSPTVAELAAAAVPVKRPRAEPRPAAGPLPLTPIQRWFFEQELPEPHHYNQAILLEPRPELEPGVVKAAVGHVLGHHDALRLRFRRGACGWEQEAVDAEPGRVFTLEDLAGLDGEERGRVLARRAAELQASLSLGEGPLVRAAYFAGEGRRPGRLLLLVHHLAVDAVSWRILVEDLETACRQLRQGRPIALPAKTTSFREWAARLEDHACSSATAAELGYWLSRPWTKVRPIPVDFAGGANAERSASSVAMALDGEETRALLHDVPGAYHTRINDVLLAALAQVFAEWSGSHTLLVDLEGHGREPLFDDVDLSRTVGWFTSVFPVLLDLPPGRWPGEALVSIKEQLRGIPRQGIGYGLLRHLSGEAGVRERLRALPLAQVCFNYLGQVDAGLAPDSLLRLVGEETGPVRGPLGRRSYLLEIEALVREQRLEVQWTYGEDVHRRTTVEQLAGGFLRALRAILSHCRSTTAEHYTPSDFPMARLNQKQLDRVLGRVRRGTESPP
jgi:non-ribosomal peptide synthase protein (TIGR01720 family)